MEAREMMFDTKAYTDTLRDAGVPDRQADGFLRALKQALIETVATRSDVLGVRRDLSTEIKALRTDLGEEIKAVRTDLGKEIAELGHRTDKQFLEMRADMTAFKGEVKEELAAMRADMSGMVYKKLIPAMMASTALLGVLIAVFGK